MRQQEPEDKDELTLIYRAAEGDHEAFRSLVVLYEAQLLGYLTHMLGDSESATYKAGVVFDLGWSPDGKYIAVTEVKAEVNGKEICHVQVWDAMTGKTLSTYSSIELSYLTWAPDGKRIAVASGTEAQVLEPTTGKILFTYTADPTPNDVGVLKWSPDGKYVASVSNPNYSTSTPTTNYTAVQVWIAP